VKKRIAGKNSRPEVHGELTTGRIVRIVRGQGHGFIRAKDGGEVFFHRSDVPNDTFNDLTVGDHVTFERVTDVVSGARALYLKTC
jgi:cold shock CspA family protein